MKRFIAIAVLLAATFSGSVPDYDVIATDSNFRAEKARRPRYTEISIYKRGR